MNWLVPIFVACIPLLAVAEPGLPAALRAELEKPWPNNRAIHLVFHALNDRRLPEAEVETAWRAMARAAKAKGVPVVFLTPTGASGVRIGADDEALEIRAEIIRKVAAEEGLPVADVWAAWKAALAGGVKQESLRSQGNHPNRQGHELAAKVIAKWFGVD
jgi:lysophospholipase L1-like esterase